MRKLTYAELLELVAQDRAPECVEFEGELYTYNKEGRYYENNCEMASYVYLLSHISNVLGDGDLFTARTFKTMKYLPHLMLDITSAEAIEMIHEIISSVERKIIADRPLFTEKTCDDIFDDIARILKSHSRAPGGN